ncbi:MAG TPA: primosomal protein N' [Syntrophorhabdaceae bacterium]|nr:primosomal protein N' [Syntrophorhabdaceae bacterium]HPU29059.1 primosomal protein N' [Syntrophorhabdaceae bacterium]
MIAEIALPIPVSKTFSYSVPEHLCPIIKKFQRVIVPFRNKHTSGFVIDVEDASNAGLKEISQIIDFYPLIDKNIERLCYWAGNHYVTPMGIVLKYALPKYLKPERYLLSRFNCDCHYRLWESKKDLPFEKVLSLMGIEDVISHLQEKKVVLYDKFTKKAFTEDIVSQTYSKEGKRFLFLGAIQRRIKFYLNLMEDQINKGRNVLMLLPDYNLSGGFFYKILSEKFKKKVFWYGSSVSQNLRMESYFRARNETGNIILGNKSAIFLPIMNLSMIIVERHEEDSFRNESEFRFNAWEVAKKRAEIENIPLILGSVSPKIEIFKGINEGEYALIEDELPLLKNFYQIEINRKRFFSGSIPQEMETIIKDKDKSKKKTIVFTPRKYYSSHIHCINCGYNFICPLCASPLTYKKNEDRLYCQACQKDFDYRNFCPQCRSDLIGFFQFGVEFLEEMLKKAIPDKHIILLTGDSIEESKSLEIKSVHDAEIIIGTNIISKLYGIECDKLIFIGIEDMLSMAGYRAEEKLFQFLYNTLDALNPEAIYFFVDEKKGFNLEHFLYYKEFYIEELEKRRLAEFPPFKNIYLITIEKKTLNAGQRALNTIKQRIEAWGLKEYMKGPLYEKKKRYQWKIMLKDYDERIKDLLFSLYDIQDITIEVNPLHI